MSNSSFKVRSGTATITSASRCDIAKILGVRRNAAAIRRGLEIINRPNDQELNCVVAVTLLLLQEYDRIGMDFGVEAYESVATVFWHAIARNQHAIARNQGAIALDGPTERCEQILQRRPARSRLADELTGRPSIHRYMYRANNGKVATALDASVLQQKRVVANDIIDLEAIAEQLIQRMGRPIINLMLK